MERNWTVRRGGASLVPFRICQWQSYFMMSRFHFRTEPNVIENRLRSKINGTISFTSGLLDGDPLDLTHEQEFDFVLVNQVLQAVCRNMEDYTEALRRLKRYVRTGGHLCVCDLLGETATTCLGDEKLRFFSLRYNGVLNSFRDAGLDVVETMEKRFTSGSGNTRLKVSPDVWHLTVAKVV